MKPSPPIPSARIAAPGDSGRNSPPQTARRDRGSLPANPVADALRDYPGAKGGPGVWQTIVNQVPPHRLWIEAFVGSGAVTRALRPAPRRIVIDRDAAVVAAWQSVPGVSAVCADAVEWLAETRFGMNPADVVVYCDPPYLRSVRSCQRDYYRHEFASADDHRRLLAVLRALPARVILSGYPSELYNRELSEWRTVTFQTITHRGRTVTECLWLNFPEPFALHDYRWLGQNFRERERIKRKKSRWHRRLLAMPMLERAAIVETIAELLAENSEAGPIAEPPAASPGKALQDPLTSLGNARCHANENR